MCVGILQAVQTLFHRNYHSPFCSLPTETDGLFTLVKLGCDWFDGCLFYVDMLAEAPTPPIQYPSMYNTHIVSMCIIIQYRLEFAPLGRQIHLRSMVGLQYVGCSHKQTDWIHINTNTWFSICDWFYWKCSEAFSQHRSFHWWYRRIQIVTPRVWPTTAL